MILWVFEKVRMIPLKKKSPSILLLVIGITANLVHVHIIYCITNCKIGVAPVLIPQGEIILVQRIFDSYELGEGINLKQLKEKVQQLTQEETTSFINITPGLSSWRWSTVIQMWYCERHKDWWWAASTLGVSTIMRFL